MNPTLTIPRARLYAMLERVLSAAKAENMKPEYGRVRIVADASPQGLLTVEATNSTYHTLYSASLGDEEATVQGEFAVCVEGAMLKTLLRLLTSDSLELTAREQQVQMKSGKDVFMLDGLAPEGWAPPQTFIDAGLVPSDSASSDASKIEAVAPISVRADELARALGAVAHAMPASDIRHYLVGTLLHHTGGGNINCVATDGHRMAVTTLRAVPSMQGEAPEVQVILPRRFALDLARQLEQSKDEAAQIRIIDRRLVSVVVGGVRMTSNLVEGKYPDYQRVMPAKRIANIALDAQELNAALRAANAVLAGATAVPAVRLSAEEDLVNAALRIVSGTSERQAANVALIAKTYAAGPSAEVAVNGAYMVDAVAAAVAEEVTLSLPTASDQPLRIDSDAADSSVVLRSVIMPVRI